MCWETNTPDFASSHACQKAIPFPFLFTSKPTVIAVKNTLNSNTSNSAVDISVDIGIRTVSESSFIAVMQSSNGGFTSDNYKNWGLSWVAFGY